MEEGTTTSHWNQALHLELQTSRTPESLNKITVELQSLLEVSSFSGVAMTL
jgi:hypothetical protein